MTNPFTSFSIPAPDCRRAYVEKTKTLPGGCEINVGACRQIRCRAGRYGCSRNTFCQPIMEERKFECGDKVYVEKVVARCTCQEKIKVEVRGRVVEREGRDGMFIKLFYTFI